MPVYDCVLLMALEFVAVILCFDLEQEQISADECCERGVPKKTLVLIKANASRA